MLSLLLYQRCMRIISLQELKAHDGRGSGGDDRLAPIPCVLTQLPMQTVSLRVSLKDESLKVRVDSGGEGWSTAATTGPHEADTATAA